MQQGREEGFGPVNSVCSMGPEIDIISIKFDIKNIFFNQKKKEIKEKIFFNKNIN